MRRGAVALGIAAALVACGDTPVESPEVELHRTEFTIHYVERLPRIHRIPIPGKEYDPDGWPEPGQTVTWRAHVENRTSESHEVGYRWELDGTPVAEGTLSFGGRGLQTADLPWTWTFDRHEIRFVLDPDDAIAEIEEGNNSVRLFTDARPVGFWVDREVARAHREVQPSLGLASTSFADWAHRHLEFFNRIAEQAVYPESPDGVHERWRLDLVEYGPTEGDLGTDVFTVDMLWRFPERQADIFRRNSQLMAYNGALLHELGHRRGLIDVYATKVYHGFPGHSVDVTESGEPVVGSVHLPIETRVRRYFGVEGVTLEGYRVRSAIMQGLMGSDYGFLDRFSAGALESAWGRGEATDGRTLLEILPTDLRIRVTDTSGAPLPGASVTLYRGEPAEGPGYARTIDDVPDLVAIAGPGGIASLGANPFALDGSGTLSLPRMVALVRIEHEGAVAFDFLYSLPFTMAYWRGHEDAYTIDFPVELRDPSARQE